LLFLLARILLLTNPTLEENVPRETEVQGSLISQLPKENVEQEEPEVQVLLKKKRIIIRPSTNTSFPRVTVSPLPPSKRARVDDPVLVMKPFKIVHPTSVSSTSSSSSGHNNLNNTQVHSEVFDAVKSHLRENHVAVVSSPRPINPKNQILLICSKANFPRSLRRMSMFLIRTHHLHQFFNHENLLLHRLFV
ncbi:hypothetical protein CFOL_v3_33107, partial [Cephalotus follicularis]